MANNAAPQTTNTNIPALTVPIDETAQLYQNTMIQAALANINSNIAAVKASIPVIPPGIVFGTNIQPVGSSDSPGSGSDAVHDNHAHQGVHKINENADAFGDISFTGELVSQSGNTFNFSLLTSVLLGITTYTNPASNVVVTGGGALLLSNSHGVNLELPPSSSNANRMFYLGARTNTVVPVVAQNGTDTVESPNGRGNTFYWTPGTGTWYCIMSINLP